MCMCVPEAEQVRDVTIETADCEYSAREVVFFRLNTS